MVISIYSLEILCRIYICWGATEYSKDFAGEKNVLKFEMRGMAVDVPRKQGQWPQTHTDWLCGF